MHPVRFVFTPLSLFYEPNKQFGHILFYRAGIGAGGAFLAGRSVGAGLRAMAHATLTAAASATQHANGRHAGVCARGAVTVLTLPAGVALAEAAVALPVI